MKNFWAYLQERFPLQANGLLIASYFTANYLLASDTVSRAGRPLELSWRLPVGYLALLFMFFHMRVIDEHKDYERDRMVYPDRILSRGLVTLSQLRTAGIAAVILELVFSALLGFPAFAMCVVILAFSWLIYKGFYMEDTLDRHLLANAFLHLAIMPIYSLFVFAAATQKFPWFAPAAVLLYAWVSYGVGFAYEVARKTRAPADERPGLITYSRVLGSYPSAYGSLLALLFSAVISILVGLLMNFEWWYHGTIIVLLLLVAFGVLHFRLRTTSATAASLQVYAGMFIFVFDVLLAVELIHLNGVIWL